jgi:predicted nucleic acid-binding protein
MTPTSTASMTTARQVYLINTNIISELRKGKAVDRGVIEFMSKATAGNRGCYLSVVTIGELQRGISMIQYRGDTNQANTLMDWLENIVTEYKHYILPIDQDVAKIWANLRVPHHENAIDKMIAATALLHSLTLVTRNTKDFERTGVSFVNPFQSAQ